MMKQISLIAILATLVIATTTATSVQAKNLLHDLGDAADQFGQGQDDGKDAGARGESSTCPSTDTAYCAGWNGGWSEGNRARNTVDQAQNGDDGEFVEND